jgi:hypothetical protein
MQPPEWYIAACLGDFTRIDEMAVGDDNQDSRARRFPDLAWAMRAPHGIPETLAAHYPREVVERVRSALGCDADGSLAADGAVFEVRSGPAGARLSAAAKKLLSELPASQFIRKRSVLGNRFTPEAPGVLDLFAGSKGFAKACIRAGAPWVLCYDVKDSADQDLTSPTVVSQISDMISSGCFIAFGMGPVL